MSWRHWPSSGWDVKPSPYGTYKEKEDTECPVALSLLTRLPARLDVEIPSQRVLLWLSFYRFSESNVQGLPSEERKRVSSQHRCRLHRVLHHAGSQWNSHELARLDLLWLNRQHTRLGRPPPHTRI